MERLTKYENSQSEYIIDCKFESCNTCKENILDLCSMQDKVIQKCGEYENTGLTPQEVEFYVKCGNKLIDKELLKLQEENAELKAKLEKAVELPCKVGDILYKKDYLGDKIREYKVMAVITFNSTSSVKNRVEITARNYRGASVPIDGDCFGKTVFLTKEAAEQALKGGNENA